MTNYIDIHSHNKNSSGLTIVNCFPSEIEFVLQNKPQQFCSLGIHPWYIKTTSLQQELESVSLFVTNKQVLAIGETGLDKLCNTPFELQKEVFILQANLSEQIQKPLIIHCVKAYSELIQLKKKLHPTMPWILHGYRGNKQITQQLLTHNFFFSFGKGISLLQESIELIPLNKIFFETDDGEIKIEEIYHTATQIIQIPTNLLLKEVMITFETVFRKY